MSETWSDSEEIECPKCGGKLRDLYEHFTANNSDVDIECDHCGAELTLSRNISVDYVCSEATPGAVEMHLAELDEEAGFTGPLSLAHKFKRKNVLRQ